MSERPVHWHEGMFLRPHHFQAAGRHQEALAARHARWTENYSWGVRRLKIDAEALAGFRFGVDELQARLLDGTPLDLDDLSDPLSLDLKPAFQESQRLEVRLAVPSYRPGWPNLENGDGAADARYRTLGLGVEDENTGADQQPLTFRSLNARLIAGPAGAFPPSAGYETLPLARVRKADRPEAAPELDPDFFPPVLCCDAWEGLQRDTLQETCHRLKRKGEILASQVISRGITLDTRAPGDALKMAQLRIINEALAALESIAFIPGVRALDGYREMCRVVGQLSVFADERRPPELPPYDHDDLARCFREAKVQIESLLGKVEDPVVVERTFVGSGKRMQVSLERDWLDPSWRMFIGVKSSLDIPKCQSLLARPEKLGMKIGASDRVDQIFRGGVPGLRFMPVHEPPRDLPPGRAYFEVTRDPPNEWGRVDESLSLALRLQNIGSQGAIEGREEVTIDVESTVATFRFLLCALPGGN